MKSKQIHKKTISKEKQIVIKAELPVPLVELAIYILKKDENENRLLDLLYHRPEIINKLIKKIIKAVICEKKLNIKIMEIKFDYNDNDDVDHGVSYFIVILKGMKKELKKMAGKNKTCCYDWEEHNKNNSTLIAYT